MGGSARKLRRGGFNADLRELAERYDERVSEFQGAIESTTDQSPTTQDSAEQRRSVNTPPQGGSGRECFATTEEVAMLFRVHAKTVERWRKTLGLPCLRLGGRVRYDVSEVLRWASARKEAV